MALNHSGLLVQVHSQMVQPYGPRAKVMTIIVCYNTHPDKKWGWSVDERQAQKRWSWESEDFEKTEVG